MAVISQYRSSRSFDRGYLKLYVENRKMKGGDVGSKVTYREILGQTIGTRLISDCRFQIADR